MSKKTNQAKQAAGRKKVHKPKRDRRRRNPALGLIPDNLPISPGLFGSEFDRLYALARGAVALLELFSERPFRVPEPKPAIQCSVCDGTCLCHHIGALGGIPCPDDCPNRGKKLDGCHKCDCVGAPA